MQSQIEKIYRVKTLKEKNNEVYHFGFGQSPFPVPEIVVKSLQKYANEKDYLPTRGKAEIPTF